MLAIFPGLVEWGYSYKWGTSCSFFLLPVIQNTCVLEPRQNRMVPKGCILHSPKGTFPSLPCFQVIRGQTVPLEETGCAGTYLQENEGNRHYCHTSDSLSCLFGFFPPHAEIWGVKEEQILNRCHLAFMGQSKLYEAVENYLGMVWAFLSAVVIQ